MDFWVQYSNYRIFKFYTIDFSGQRVGGNSVLRGGRALVSAAAVFVSVLHHASRITLSCRSRIRVGGYSVSELHVSP